MLKIKVVNPQTSSDKAIQYHETEANNWGELESELRSAGILSGTMQVVIKENKNELSLPAAILPVGLGAAANVPVDFTLFLSPKQVKSGVNIEEQAKIVEDYLTENDAEVSVCVAFGVLKGILTVGYYNDIPGVDEINNTDADLEEARNLNFN